MPYIGQGLTEGRRRAYNFVATGSQTTFSATYDVGYVDVYQNGILLSTTDYTATNGTTVVLSVGASASDEITIIAHQIFTISDTVSAGQGGTFGGAIDVTGNITTTGSLRGPSSFTIDPATHGDNTGTVVIAGDLTVNGTTTTINSTTLTVDDKNIIIASGTSNSSTADGSGLTIDLGSDGTATMVYTHATTSIDFNKNISATLATASQPNITSVGTLTSLNTSGDIYLGGDKGIFFEGSTNDAAEVYLRSVDATADRSIRLPDASGTLLIQDSSNDVTIQADTTTSGVDPTITLYKNDTGNGSDGDGVAAISFKGKNSSGGDHVYGWMQTGITTATAGSEEGSFRISVAGSNTSYQNEAYAGGTGLTIFNDRTEFKNSVKLVNTTNSSNSYWYDDPVLTLYRADPNVAQYDYLGAIHFSGMNSADEETVYTRMVARPWQIADGNEEGNLQLLQINGGTEAITFDFRASKFRLRSEQTIEWIDHKGTNYECTLDWETPSANRTVTFPNQTGTVIVANSSGNVGIGTTSPAEKLDVAGVIQTKTAVGTHPAIRFMEGSDTRAYLGAGDWAVNGLADDDFGIASSYTGEFAIATAFANRFHITNAGNIGIGTTSPADLLEISRTSTDQTVGLTLTNQQAGGYGSGIVWRSKRTDNSAIVEAAEIRVTGENSWNGASNVASQMQFATQKDGTLTQHMVISKNGFVGIGETSPDADLHVYRGSNNNTGHFKMGHTRQRRGYVGISSSQTRWYKIMNYASGEIFTGVAQLFHNRGGGFNQTGAYRTYNASVAGYNNGIYGPMTATGDSGESGSGVLEFGSDEALYLKVNTSIYAGTIYFTFTGTGNGVGGGWQFNVNNYSTSLP